MKKIVYIGSLILVFAFLSFNNVYAEETPDEYISKMPIDTSVTDFTDDEIDIDSALEVEDKVETESETEVEETIEVKEEETLIDEEISEEIYKEETPIYVDATSEPEPIVLGLKTDEEDGIKSGSSVDETNLPGARSATNKYGDVFLGGNYIEVGISVGGTFGTSTAAPSDFGSHATAYNDYQLGLIMDNDGWNVGESPTTGDFFLPGTPEERYGIGYKIGDRTYQYLRADRNSTATSGFEVSTVDASDIENGILKAIVTGVTPHNVKVENIYTFNVDDKYYSTEVRITNLGTETITDVRFMRSFDPDQDVEKYGIYETYNKVICNPDSEVEGGIDNFAMVVARGARSLEGFFFVSFDNRARASRGVSFSPSSVYMNGLWIDKVEGLPNSSTDESLAMSKENVNGYRYEDNAIALTFNIGTIEPGQQESFSHFSSLDPDVIESLAKIIDVVSASLINVTDNSLTIKTEEGYEYSIDGGKTWQTDGTFTGLEANTEYTILSRIIGETEVGESVASTKKSGEQTPKISERIVTENSITVSGNTELEYSIDGGENWQNSPEFTGLTEETEYEIIARYKETETSMPGIPTDPLKVTTLPKEDIDLGDVSIVVELNGSIPKVLINKAAIYDSIGEDEELDSAIEENQNVEIKLVINDSILSDEEVDLINGKLNDNEVIAYTMDVGIELYIDGVYIKNITELKKAITYKVGVPEELINNNRKFRIFRTHLTEDGYEITELTDEDEDLFTITTTSDRFSNYTLVYEEEKEEEEIIVADVEEKNDFSKPSIVTKNPKTGDSIIKNIILFALSFVGILFITRNNKKLDY